MQTKKRGMMDRTDIKILLLKKGTSFYQIARDLDMTPVMVYDTLNGKTDSARITRRLEELFGLSIAEIRAAWKNIPMRESRSGSGQGLHEGKTA